VPSWLSVNDKVAHAGLYAVLGAGLGWGRHYDVAPPPHVVLLTLGALYGATDEWHQASVYGRTPGWGDWIADVVGVLLGYFLTLVILSRATGGATSQSRPSVDVPD
jgi:VanZ family protein